MTVVKGRNAIIDCDTDAYPEPVITWSRAEGIFFPFLLFCTENFHSFFSLWFRRRFRSQLQPNN